MKKYIILTIIACTVVFANAHAQNFVFSNDLSVGSSGSDVTNLQTWLISNGFDIPSVSSGVAVKGYFGSQTKLALIRYQLSLGFPAFGYFGPMTRGYINGHSNPNNASFKVTSPNGGETWVKGTIQNITWSGSANVLAQKGDIKLVFPTPACAQPGQPIKCMVMVRAPLTIAKGVNLSAKSYSWNVGTARANWCLTSIDDSSCPLDSSAITEGQYKVQICPADGSTCAESDSNFTITSNPVTTGNAPVINGVDAPTTLAVGQTGTWTVRATDPLNGTLSYRIRWGDEPSYYVPAGVADPLATFSQMTTFTHSYINPGTYTVTVIVMNSSGQQVQTTSTIVVTSGTTAGSLKIISPNGGEAWVRGTTQNITWSSPYYFRATYADLKIMQKFVCTTQFCPAIAYAPYTIATNIPINQNSYSWNVGTALNYSGIVQTMPDGQYTVQICETGTTNCDSSDNVFTISSTQTSNVPDINIISPNGGEQWQTSTYKTVTLNVTGDSALIGDTVYVYAVDSLNKQTLMSTQHVASPGIKNFSLLVNVSLPYFTAPGLYRLYVTLNKGVTMQAYDYSDAYFTIGLPPCPTGYSCAPTPSY
ncbi:MAG: PKD domain-containing protein [Candidatus Pacebacteria bacterium]|nr:PKD domain-containing protein [Candidatus Paceibacterota bacterium]